MIQAAFIPSEFLLAIATFLLLILAASLVLIFRAQLPRSTKINLALFVIATAITTGSALILDSPPDEQAKSFTSFTHIKVSTTFFIIGLLFLAFSFYRLVNTHLPQYIDEIARNKQNAEVFKQSYKQIKRELEKRNEETEALSAEIDKLYQHQHHRELFGSNSVDLYRKLFDSSPIFYIALSDKGEINDINTHACETLKYNFAELISSHFLDIVIPEDRHRVGLLIQSFKGRGQAENEFETALRDRDRKQHAVIIKMHNLRYGDREITYLYCIDVSESKALSQTLAYQANHDELTELFNRRALERYFNELNSPKFKNTTMALVYFDLDQLKVVNDTCGHTAGDQLLKQLVAIIKSVCERYGCSIFARIGGDEFAIAVPNFDKEKVGLFAEALRSAAEDLTFTWDNKSFRQSISVGVAYSQNPKVGLNELLSAADAACYQAKDKGRNQVKVNTVEEHVATVDHRQSMHWVARLDKAIKNGEFLLNFQPIARVDKPFSPYIHYEVLLQYLDSNGNKVPPGNFLPAAERFGKSTDIDLWVITETFDFLSKNPVHTRFLSCCSINLTSHTIANHRSREAIISLVKSHNFPAGKVCFEITETSAISNLSEAIDFITTLRALGCRFALDDFGTGFSSFGYLKNLDVDYLKIDGSFIKDLNRDKLDKAMTQAICSIAKEMGIKTVAEYVENDQIMRELKSLGVDLGQGYAIAKPMPIDAIHEFYHDYSAFATQ